MANPHRQEKLGEQIAADLSDLFRTQVRDPRVGFASITRVDVSGDIRHAKIHVSVMGNADEQKEAIKTLTRMRGFLRHELAQRIQIRFMPELHFQLDTSIEEGARILDLINKVNEEDRSRQQESAERE